MRKNYRIIWVVALLVLLTGCQGLLERESTIATVHSVAPREAGDSNALRVENYQEMVNALLYLVTQGEEAGALRLYGYDQDSATEDLTAACLEISTEVPIGAYSVSYLQFDLTTIVSYLEADISITYRRTHQQVENIESAVGPSAIRTQLARGLEEFSQEIVLQVNYFDGNEADLEELIHRAYYEIPGSALGMPMIDIEFYPRTGTQRIAEVLLDYPITPAQQESRAASTRVMAARLVRESWALSDQTLLIELCRLVIERGGLAKEGDTAYDALMADGATSEGLALALALLCEEREVICSVVQGTKNGVPHFWNVIMTPQGYRHVDLTAFAQGEWQQEQLTVEDEKEILFPDKIAVQQGYSWNQNLVPLCGEQPAEGSEALLMMP